MPDVDRNSDEFQAALKEAVEAEVEGLRGKNTELIGKNKKLAGRLQDLEARFDGIDPDEVRAMLAAREKAADEDAKKKGDWDQLREKLEARHATALKAVEDRNATLESELRRHLVNDALGSAIADVGVLEDYRGAVTSLLRDRGPKVVEDDGQFRAVFTDDVGDPVPLADFVTAWSKSAAAAPFMPGTGTTGTGAESGGNTRSRAAGVRTIKRDDLIGRGRHAEAIAKGEIEVVD